MRRIITYIAWLLLFSCSPEKQVEVVTLNIRNQNLDDGANSWQARLPLVQDFFEDENFDIIGLQEVTAQQLFDLKNLLTDYDYVGNGRGNGNDEGEYCPVFYKKASYSLMAKSQFWLSDTPEIPGSISWGGTFPRLVTWVKLKSNSSGHIFYVFNTHFCHMSAMAREKSAALLLQKILEIAGEAPVILTGDFNMGQEAREYELLTSNWDRFYSLMDAETIARKHINKDTPTFNGYSKSPSSAKIDYILVNSYFSVSKYEVHLVKDNGVFISDHNPVSAKMTFLFERKPRPGHVYDAPWETN
jgi:endonuclease/exonuclease/phosphatase family metal-dependent hydrolase